MLEKNGYLSGQFYMIMDCWGGAKIKCEFSKTQINTDNIVLNTIFHNVSDSTLYVKPETIRKEIQEAFFDAATVLTDFSIKDTVKIDKPYTYLYINESGKVVAVIDDKGKIKTEETTISATNLKENTLIQGKNGEELVLTKKGQVMGKEEFNATGGNSVLLKDYHRKSDSLAQWQINFLPDTKHQTYAFDRIGSGDHGIFATDEYYPKSGSYDFRYKSVECGKNDKVIVDFGSYPQADSVIFKDKYGVKLKVVDGNILAFIGVSKADTNYIYAYRGDQKIGKLFLNTYQKKTYNVVLVSVNEAKILHEKNVDKAVKKVEESLNKVYNQCAVSFKITHAVISIDDLTSFSHGGSGILTVYNDDQKKVLSAYEKEKKMTDGVFYLFFIDNVTDKKDGSGTPVSGYMPRGYNAGFIYDGGSPRTIAHELGHGIAGLEHVFENSNNSGKTANLMDYASGEELWHFQWDQIQDPSRVWMKWNKAESEGENRLDNQFYFQEKCKKIYFIFSPYFSKKFELLLQSDGNIIQSLDSWASGTTTLNATQSKNVRNNIIKSTIWDSKDYQTKIDYFKSQYTDNTPIVQIVNNPDGTDSQHIAVYSLIGVATNITSLEDFNRSDISIQEPYFLSRYEVDVSNGKTQHTTQRDVAETIFDFAKDLFGGRGVFHLDLTSGYQVGAVAVNLGRNATCGIGIDFNKCVALFGNSQFFANFASRYGIDLNFDTYKDFSVVKAEEMLSWTSGLSANSFSFSFNVDYGYKDVRDLFGVSSSVVLDGILGPLDLQFNINNVEQMVGVGLGYSHGAGISISRIMTRTKGFIFTTDEFSGFVKWLGSADFDFESLTFKYNKGNDACGIRMIKEKPDSDYWISEEALNNLKNNNNKTK